MNKTGAAPENGARLLDRFLLPTERRPLPAGGGGFVPGVTHGEENDEGLEAG